MREASEGLQDLIGQRVVGVCIQPWGSLADVSVAVGSSLFVAPRSSTTRRPRPSSSPPTPGTTPCTGAGRSPRARRCWCSARRADSARRACSSPSRGAHVVALVGSPEKAEHCRELGAESTVDHSAVDLVEGVRAVTGGRGVDVVIDPVQGEMGAAARSLLVPDGRHVLCGHVGGLVPIDPALLRRQRHARGRDARWLRAEIMREMFVDAERDLLAMMDVGTFRPTPTETVDFGDVPAVLTEMAARHTIGRPVVRIAG